MHPVAEEARYFKYGIQTTVLIIKTMPALCPQLQLPQINPSFSSGICQQLQ